VQPILIVDDDDDVRDACVAVLGEEGYTTRTARNGREALDLLHQDLHPAVILLDLMMPEMNGFEFRARQLADPSIADLPVVVLTAGTMSDRIRQLHPDACLTKPFELDDLLGAVASAARRDGEPPPQGPR
jgi:CheY-like chemotaxis protein